MKPRTYQRSPAQQHKHDRVMRTIGLCVVFIGLAIAIAALLLGGAAC